MHEADRRQTGVRPGKGSTKRAGRKEARGRQEAGRREARDRLEAVRGQAVLRQEAGRRRQRCMQKKSGSKQQEGLRQAKGADGGQEACLSWQEIDRSRQEVSRRQE
jgi:hypothetical protein